MLKQSDKDDQADNVPISRKDGVSTKYFSTKTYIMGTLEALHQGTEALLMSTHNIMFAWRNKEKYKYFWLKKLS